MPYSARLVSFAERPVLSFVDGSSSFAQVFNPSYVVPSNGTAGRAGLLARTQNCSALPGGRCVGCHGTGAYASVLTFAESLGAGGDRFAHVDGASVVFGPHDASDDYGTEDPRLVYDGATALYYLFYTCFNSGKSSLPRVSLCLATAKDPTRRAGGWVRHGTVGFGANSKSAALLLGEASARAEGEAGPGAAPRAERLHHLFWGAGTIRVARSTNLTRWPSAGDVLLNRTLWGNPHVEAGPPPLRLSTGDFVFFFNSWTRWPPGGTAGYEPGWAVLSGADPTRIVAQASAPLFEAAREPWLTGNAPYTCNVPNVAFVEAAVAEPSSGPDTFRIYFGGADSVVGTALVQLSADPPPQPVRRAPARSVA